MYIDTSISLQDGIQHQCCLPPSNDNGDDDSYKLLFKNDDHNNDYYRMLHSGIKNRNFIFKW